MNQEELIQILARVGDPCTYTQTTSLEELYAAITMAPPFGDDLLFHAEVCPKCAARIQDARQHDIDSIGFEERQKLEGALQSIKEHSQHAIGDSQALKAAFRPSRMGAAAREHVQRCAVCQHRLRSARNQAHPAPADLLLYYAGVLKAEDAQAIKQHVTDFCLDRSCDRFHLLHRLRDQITRVAGAADELVVGLLSFNLALPEPELLYSDSDRPTAQFHELLRSSDWEVTIEQAPEDRFFLGVRSRVPRRDVTRVQVAVLRGDTVFEMELRWESDQYWSAKEYFEGFERLIGDTGPASVLVLPLANAK